MTTAGEYLLPALLKGFRVQRPDIQVSLDVDNREHVMERLARREIDVAIGGRPPSGAGIAGTPLLRYRLMVVAAAGEPVGDLSDQTWLLREPGIGHARRRRGIPRGARDHPSLDDDARLQRRHPAGGGGRAGRRR